jgi:hypothetical protein
MLLLIRRLVIILRPPGPLIHPTLRMTIPPWTMPQLRPKRLPRPFHTLKSRLLLTSPLHLLVTPPRRQSQEKTMLHYHSMVLWTRHFLEAQGHEVIDKIIYQDNESSILLEKNGQRSSTKRTRHLETRYFLSPITSSVGACESYIVPPGTWLLIFLPSHCKKGQHTENC